MGVTPTDTPTTLLVGGGAGCSVDKPQVHRHDRPVDLRELTQQARVIRETYTRETVRRYGRAWTPEEYMLGFLGDVGDLAKGQSALRLMRVKTQRSRADSGMSGRYGEAAMCLHEGRDRPPHCRQPALHLGG